MPKSLERISMTIPADALRLADKLAKAWDRSRSWVLAEAVRRLDGEAGPSIESPKPAALDSYRRQQLVADMALSVEERVIAAERTAREVPAKSFAALFIAFDRAQDYDDWKLLEAIGRV